MHLSIYIYIMCHIFYLFIYLFNLFNLLVLGGPIAASWAVLRYMGQNGYMEVAQRLMKVADIMKEGVTQIAVRRSHYSPSPF